MHIIYTGDRESRVRRSKSKSEECNIDSLWAVRVCVCVGIIFELNASSDLREARFGNSALGRHRSELNMENGWNNIVVVKV